ncbi:MAG TPA: hypothetical protein VGH98_16935 [Gemmatimonadaceae bacterium]|jgi:hypothetical protein
MKTRYRRKIERPTQRIGSGIASGERPQMRLFSETRELVAFLGALTDTVVSR